MQHKCCTTVIDGFETSRVLICEQVSPLKEREERGGDPRSMMRWCIRVKMNECRCGWGGTLFAPQEVGRLRIARGKPVHYVLHWCGTVIILPYSLWLLNAPRQKYRPDAFNNEKKKNFNSKKSNSWRYTCITDVFKLQCIFWSKKKKNWLNSQNTRNWHLIVKWWQV